MIAPTAARDSRWVHVRWATAGHHRTLTALVAAGLIGAVLLAGFGLPPIDLHSPLHRHGIMDPLCGMTRATQAFARTDLVRAWRYNPGSFLLAGIAALVLARHLYGRASGRWLEITLVRRRAIAVTAVIGIGLTVNQQLHAALLR